MNRLNRTLDSRSEIKLNEIYIKTVLLPAREREREGERARYVNMYVNGAAGVAVALPDWLSKSATHPGLGHLNETAAYALPLSHPLSPSQCTKLYALKHEKCGDHRSSSSSGSSSRTRAGLNSSVKTMRETAATV